MLIPKPWKLTFFICIPNMAIWLVKMQTIIEFTILTQSEHFWKEVFQFLWFNAGETKAFKAWGINNCGVVVYLIKLCKCGGVLTFFGVFTHHGYSRI